MNKLKLFIISGFSIFLVGLLTGCNPTVTVKAPEKPITVNMNVKIEHKIQVKVDKELDQAMQTNKNIF